jgi:hypothetical protein
MHVSVALAEFQFFLFIAIISGAAGRRRPTLMRGNVGDREREYVENAGDREREYVGVWVFGVSPENNKSRTERVESGQRRNRWGRKRWGQGKQKH